ncbi:MAG: EamA family transporter [Clostridiales bacterium]|nr:EamA family transporter [Clostridiales bacterium]
MGNIDEQSNRSHGFTPLLLLLLHAGLLVASFSGVFAKFAALEEWLSLPFFLYYGMDLVCMFVYAVIWQQVLKRMPLSVAYSNRPVSLVWGLIWGYLLFQEEVTWNKLLGAAVIFIGITIMVTNGDNDE